MPQEPTTASVTTPRRISSIVAIAILLALGAAFGWLVHKTWKRAAPAWTATVILEVNPRSFDTAPDAMRLEQEAGTLARSMISDDFLRAVLKRPEVQRTAWGRALAAAGQTRSPEDAAFDLSCHVASSTIPGTRLFRLDCTMPDRDDGPVIANAVADAWISALTMTEQSRLANELKVLEAARDMADSRRLQNRNMIQDFIRQNHLTGAVECEASLQRTLERLRLEVAQASVEAASIQDATSAPAQGEAGADRDPRAKRLDRASAALHKMETQAEELMSNLVMLRSMEQELESLKLRRDELGRSIQDLNIRLLGECIRPANVGQRATMSIPTGYPRLRFTMPAGALAFAAIGLWIRRPRSRRPS